MRVALISRVAMAVTALSSVLRGLGHEPVGVLTTSVGADRYGADTLGAITEQAAAGFDVLGAGSASEFAPLLAGLDAHVAISAAFPALLPTDALSLPRLGIVNTHPPLRPRCRVPNPIG